MPASENSQLSLRCSMLQMQEALIYSTAQLALNRLLDPSLARVHVSYAQGALYNHTWQSTCIKLGVDIESQEALSKS